MPRVHAIALLLLTALPLGGCDTQGTMRKGADSVLDIFKPPTPAEAAEMALDPYDAERRYKGTLLLANATFAGEPIYMKLFTDNLGDEDPGVRQAAVRAIANHAPPADATLILPGLADKDKGVRREAAKGLQRLHNRDAVDALIKSLKPEHEQEPAVRAEAAGALAQYAQTRVVQALIAALSDPQLSVNRRALDSLRTLTGQDFGLDRRAWLAWADEAREPFAARAAYFYPVFRREKLWWEHLPFIPPPPNEASALPAGFPATLAAPTR
jgi:hypothetical protein